MKIFEFNYYLPTRLIFGAGALNKLYGLSEVVGHNCMLLCFPGFKSEHVVEQLNRVCNLYVYDKFQENPSYGFVHGIAEEVRNQSIDTIIAIGGGSSIDAAKAAAWLSENPEGDQGTSKAARVGIVAVPTTAGTGSEVTPYAILTEDATQKKQILNHPSLFPKAALCDPELTYTMPGGVTANTGIDALSHAIEAYFSKACNGFMEDMALSCCRLVSQNLPTALKEPCNTNAREKMMMASLLGGIALSQCGTVMVHALGYGLTQAFGFSHGYANGILLAGFVERMEARGSKRAKAIMEIFDGKLDVFIRNGDIKAEGLRGRIDEIMLNQWIEAGYNSYGRVKSIVPLEREDIRFILQKLVQ